MALSESRLRAAASKAYERARWIDACCVLIFILPATFIFAHLSFRPVFTTSIGVMLAILCPYLRQRGGDAGRSVVPGLAVGFGIAGSAIAMCHLGFCGPADKELFCGMMCLFGIGGSGLLVALRRSHVAAALVTFMAGALGCAMFGLFGVAGLALGCALAAAPAAFRYAR
jgi:hypothetical protein